MTATNFSNNQCWNDFIVRSGPAGGLRKLRVQNEQNIAGSQAAVETYVEDTTGDDAFFRSVIGITHSYASGIDNTSGGHWRLTYANAANATPSSAIQIIDSDTHGRILYPNQPMLKAYLTASVANVTGDNTIYTVPFDNVVFDVDNNYDNLTGLFTAPVTGKYHIEAMITFSGLVPDYSLASGIIYKNATEICVPRINPLPTAWTDGAVPIQNYFHMSILENATVGDTFSAAVSVANTIGGGAIVDVEGGMYYTHLCIWLVG